MVIMTVQTPTAAETHRDHCGLVTRPIAKSVSQVHIQRFVVSYSDRMVADAVPGAP